VRANVIDALRVMLAVHDAARCRARGRQRTPSVDDRLVKRRDLERYLRATADLCTGQFV
jgi:hypothetical protein